MLRALWVDTAFDDGATARGIANLPENINDLLKELSTQGKRYGGLHASSGTLGSGASGSVRLALLRIIFKSVDLPEQYPVARFIIWLKNEGIYETVHDHVVKNGYNWDEELTNFYVAEGLHDALVKVKPNLFSSPATCVETLTHLYPHVQDISSDEMVRAIHQALTKNSKFPLTLIALDEVQQFIGEDSKRSMDVQEVVETCCKNLGGKLIFIGTGQTAVTGTSNLKKLEGRFTIRVELSDTDVDAVIRKVILAKKPNAIELIANVMNTNLGEISRHLSGTTICHQQDDISDFAQDYPILPIRRRFWEKTLHVLDQTGTDSQLRNQLSMVHKVIQTNMSASLGNVVPADYLYFDSANKLLQSRILPRKVYEKTMSWIKGSEDERLKARASGLVFLINKLAGSNKEIGIKATIDTLADLMVEDISQGSSALRAKLPGLLDKCELLMRVADEYRIQTPESAAWIDEFLSQRSLLVNDAQKIEVERDDRIHNHFGKIVKKLSLTQGTSKVTRDIFPIFDAQLPKDHDKQIYVWVRDGWSKDENSVRADALQARNQSPTIFVFIPKRSADDLRRNLIEYKASSATLEKRGVPNTPEGAEARAAMETTRQIAQGKIQELLDEAFSGAHVYQGGGNEILGNSMQDIILEAADNSLQRIYPQFHIADHLGWDKVYDQAKNGSPDALKAVGYQGEPAANPVCKALLGFLAGGKKGSDIRTNFEGAPYGWSGDSIDGSLRVLLVADLIRAHDERGKIVVPKDLERKAIGKTIFKMESTTVTADQRIQIRKLLQKAGIKTKPGEELNNTSMFIQKMQEMAKSAGGEAPKPEHPDTSSLEDIRLTTGNEQLLAIYNRKEELSKAFDDWSDLTAGIEMRWSSWMNLKELLRHAGDTKAAQEALQQTHAIEHQRLLLNEPDLIQPIVRSLEDALRKELTTCHQRYVSELNSRTRQLETDASWQKLPGDVRDEIKKQCEIMTVDGLSIGNREELIKALGHHPINVWNDRIDALSGRFARAMELVAKAIEPETQTVDIPRRILKTDKDIDEWLQEVKEHLKNALIKGPIVIR